MTNASGGEAAKIADISTSARDCLIHVYADILECQSGDAQTFQTTLELLR